MFIKHTLVALLSALTLLLAFAPHVAAASTTVTTNLTFQNPLYGNEGDLRATFKATPQADGTWNVAVTFKPQNLEKLFFVGGLPGGTNWVRVQGTATASANTLPNASVSIVALGLHARSPTTGQQIGLSVQSTFTVGADGVVSVQFVLV